MLFLVFYVFFFFFNDTATTEIYTLSLHDALPISPFCWRRQRACRSDRNCSPRSEEHTSELQSLTNLVCRLLLEKKKKTSKTTPGGATSSETPQTHPPGFRH